jgi:hypothetical protein
VCIIRREITKIILEALDIKGPVDIVNDSGKKMLLKNWDEASLEIRTAMREGGPDIAPWFARSISDNIVALISCIKTFIGLERPVLGEFTKKIEDLKKTVSTTIENKR